MKIRVEPLPTPVETTGLVILVDILRATSTITAALYHEARAVKPVATVEEALVLKEEGYLVAGERGGLPPEGFDLGNSPREMPRTAGRKVVLTTTNGTKALNFVKRARAVVAGSFLNLSAVQGFARRFEEVYILCAGTEGELSLEDFFFAGKVCEGLREASMVNDAAEIARQYASGIKDIEKALFHSHHAQKLVKLGLEEDVRFCARVDLYPVIPLFTREGFVPIRGVDKASPPAMSPFSPFSFTS
jgi:2-phosphosulfolactate phosphatase